MACRGTTYRHSPLIALPRRREPRLGPRLRGETIWACAGVGPTMLARLLILIARAWQLGPSLVLPSSCRYDPSCSAYAIEAVGRYGALKGGWLAAKRIARCHPWGGYGPDPVPELKPEKLKDAAL